MLKLLFLAVLFAFSSSVWAQSKTTIITTVDGEVTDVTMVDKPPPERAFNTFSEADVDADGKVNETEAHDAGILTFSAADLDSNGYLDESEYEAVATGATQLPAVE